MISIKRSLETEQLQNEIGRLEELARESLRCYVAAIEGIREHALRASPPLRERHEKRLRQLADALNEPFEAGFVASSCTELILLLSKFGDEAAEEYQQTSIDIKNLLRLATSATDTFTSRAERGTQELLQFADHIEQISTSNSLADLRRQLKDEVKHMHFCLEKMARDDSNVIQQLRSDLDLMNNRLHAAETLALTDSITSLLNRRGMESEVAKRIQAKSVFSLILFDILRFRPILDRFGRTAADNILAEAGQRLRGSIRGSDQASRWSDHEFIALLDCPLDDAVRRSRQVHQRLGGKYTLRTEKDNTIIEIFVSSGVVEHKTGETIEQLFTKADALIHAGKS